jgi:hypothetical protein
VSVPGAPRSGRQISAYVTHRPTPNAASGGGAHRPPPNAAPNATPGGPTAQRPALWVQGSRALQHRGAAGPARPQEGLPPGAPPGDRPPAFLPLYARGGWDLEGWGRAERGRRGPPEGRRGPGGGPARAAARAAARATARATARERTSITGGDSDPPCTGRRLRRKSHQVPRGFGGARQYGP